MMNRLLRLWFTIKPLKYEQIIYRLFYKFFPLKKLNNNSSNQKINLWKWDGPEVVKPSILSSSEVEYLNKKAFIDHPSAWNDSSFEKLWLYNLHYFDDLNAIDSLSRKSAQLKLVQRWIGENPPVSGNGWEPYPLSLRLINWIKWYVRAEVDEPEVLSSILQQAEALSKQLEFHILGNHLFANAKALVFVGCFFEGEVAESYLDLGLKLLDREVPEQFLEDGGHFELTPMYHCILLWDLLDLINLAQVTKNNKLSRRLNYWTDVARKALDWLKVMLHPDGQITFFNDSAIGIASKPCELLAYGRALGIESSKKIDRLETLSTSGYSRITMSSYSLFFDHAAVGPSYLPGHAHADTLSIELSVDNERVFVNSGTSVYGESFERLRQRGTAAHNTITVDDQNSSEVWGGFRVARRAFSKLIESHSEGTDVTIKASHDGYMRLPGKVVHTREIKATASQFEILDSLKGCYDSALALFHLHPDIDVQKENQEEGEGFSILLILKNGRKVKFTCSQEIVVTSSTWHPEFGVSLPNKCLNLPIISGELICTISII